MQQVGSVIRYKCVSIRSDDKRLKTSTIFADKKHPPRCNIFPASFVLFCMNAFLRFASICLFTGSAAIAQQETIPNQFWNNFAHINPSLVGVQYKHQASAQFRYQGDTSSARPNNIYGYYNTRLGALHGLGVAGQMSYSRLEKKHSISVQYSYQIPLKREFRLNLGIAPTYASYRSLINWIPPQTLEDPTLPSNDRNDYLLLHAGFSVTSEHILFGISMRSQTLVNALKNNYNFARHYYMMFSLKTPLGSRSSYDNKHSLYIDCIGATDLVGSQLQTSARAVLWNKWTILCGYRIHSGLLLGTGWELFNKFRATYNLQFGKPLFGANISPYQELSLLFKIDHQ